MNSPQQQPVPNYVPTQPKRRKTDRDGWEEIEDWRDPLPPITNIDDLE